MTLTCLVVAHQPTPLPPKEALERTPRPLTFRRKSMTPSISCGTILPRLSSVRNDLTLCKIKQVGTSCDLSARDPTPPCHPPYVRMKLFSRQILMNTSLFFSDNLAVSAQGFRRNANRVRKVCLSFTLSAAGAE